MERQFFGHYWTIQITAVHCAFLSFQQKDQIRGYLFVLGLGFRCEPEAHTPDDRNCICRVPRGRELPL